MSSPPDPTTSSEANLRTPLELALKTLTTHAFALASYAYMSSLLRRPQKTHLHVLRILFFAFVPTLPLIELLISLTRSLIHFVRHYEEDEPVHFRFYLSAALGMHADVDRNDDEGAKDTRRSVSLLEVGSPCAEQERLGWTWVFLGQMLAALFGLTQATGTIVIWVRRIAGGGEPFDFDHRNGGMGIAAAVCGVVSLLVLGLRTRWRVGKVFEASEKGEGEKGWFGKRNAGRRLLGDMFCAMFLHGAIGAIASQEVFHYYTSVGCVLFWFTGGTGFFLLWWQTVLLVVFLYVFRQDVGRRLGITASAEKFDRWAGGRQRMMFLGATTLVRVLLAGWVVLDLVWLFVVDVLQVVDMSDAHSGWWESYWWQDPLSDSLIVI